MNAKNLEQEIPFQDAGAEDLKAVETPETPEAEGEPSLQEPASASEQRAYLEQVSEASYVVNYIARISELSAEFSKEEILSQLQRYFEIKKNNLGLYNFAEAGTLAQEIWSIEEKVRGVKAEGIKPETIQSIREGLFALVLSGKVSAEAILGRLNGEVVISENPGDEIGDYQNPEKLAAFFEIKDGISNVYLYQHSVEKDSTSQQHHLQHELGHLFAETGAIWEQKVFLDFLDAVSKMDDAKIAEIAEQAPELASIYRLIKNPQEAVFFRPYIQDKLAQIPTLPDEKKPEARRTAAKEIIAEMTAFYLGSANSELSYFNARLEMVGKDFGKLLTEISGAQSYDTYLQVHNLEGKELTLEQKFEVIKSIPEFQADFQTQKLFLAKMEQSFAQRGQNIKPMSETMGVGQSMAYADEDFGDYDDLYFSQASSSIGGRDRDSTVSGGQTGQAENPLNTVWDFVTGAEGSSPA